MIRIYDHNFKAEDLRLSNALYKITQTDLDSRIPSDNFRVKIFCSSLEIIEKLLNIFVKKAA